MKRRTIKRGIYKGEVATVSSVDEPEEFERALRETAENEQPEKMISEAEQLAKNVIGGAGIKLDDLFDRGENGNSWHIDDYDREQLNPTVAQALDLLWHVELISKRQDLSSSASRNSFWAGHGLGARVEQLKANLIVFGKLQKTRSITAENLSEAERRYKTRAEQANHLGISTRHLRRLLERKNKK